MSASVHLVELNRRSAAAFNARDIEALLALTDPRGEFDTAGMAELGGVPAYHGHDGVRAWLRDLDEVSEEFHFEPRAYFDLGEQTLTCGVQRGRGRQSGVQVEMAINIVARWRTGRTVYSKAFVCREDALRDLGVTEDELEAIARR